MHRNRNIENRLMFIFSAHNFSQMYRRLRFVREYAVYQRAQGEAVETMKKEVGKAAEELSATKRQKNDLLYRGEQEKKALEGKQQEQQNVVTSLQKQQKQIQDIISQQQKKDAELNARIDKMIAEEIARAKARAEAERKRKAAEEAAKKRAEELARKKAAAEAAARENARRIAEAKAREEKAKAEARAAARKSAEEKRKAEEEARKAERARREEERKAAAEAKAREKDLAEEKRKVKEESDWTVSTEDRKLAGSFESNRGRLPMPLTGGYKIVNRFGQYTVDGVKGNISLDNKGIKIKGQPGAYARSVYDGKVTAVFGYDGAMVVIISHGTYLTVYTNLAAVSVINGQKVTARQTLGRIGGDGIMQFQLRRGNTPLNPMSWLGK
jgi:septal ring factor EnvC (AmiA/AmiB activator)